MNLGTEARTRRRELRLTQQELADLAGVSERFVRDFEAGKETVSLAHARRVLETLGLHLTLRGPG